MTTFAISHCHFQRDRDQPVLQKDVEITNRERKKSKELEAKVRSWKRN